MLVRLNSVVKLAYNSQKFVNRKLSTSLKIPPMLKGKVNIKPKNTHERGLFSLFLPSEKPDIHLKKPFDFTSIPERKNDDLRFQLSRLFDHPKTTKFLSEIVPNIGNQLYLDNPLNLQSWNSRGWCGSVSGIVYACLKLLGFPIHIRTVKHDWLMNDGHFERTYLHVFLACQQKNDDLFYIDLTANQFLSEPIKMQPVGPLAYIGLPLEFEEGFGMERYEKYWKNSHENISLCKPAYNQIMSGLKGQSSLSDELILVSPRILCTTPNNQMSLNLMGAIIEWIQEVCNESI